MKPISPDHPYLADLKAENLPVQDKDHLYQPEFTNWPIYNVTFHKLQTGFNISVSVKRSTLSFWESCNYFNPIPFELAPVMKELL